MEKHFNLRAVSINYRKRGFSYGFISEKTGIPKSTLSNWLQRIPYTPNKEMIKRIGIARMKSGAYKHNQMIVDTKRIKAMANIELGRLSKRDLWLLGIGLYLGEGGKSHESVRIINSDPRIVKLSILWFKRICGVKTKNFSPVVHIYPDNDLKKTIRYWSRLTGIPEKQFQKTQIDRRTNKSVRKKNMLPYGTINLQVRSREKKEFGVALHRRIMGWLESSIKQIVRV